MGKIAYISERRTDGIMSALGMHPFQVQPGHSLDSLIRELRYKEYSVLFVSESLYVEHTDTIRSFDTDLSISIHVLASNGEMGDQGLKRLVALTEEAVGVSLKMEE